MEDREEYITFLEDELATVNYNLMKANQTIEKSEEAMELRKVQIQKDCQVKIDDVRTTVTDFIDQLTWRDERSRGYVIRARHPDLEKVLRPKLENIANLHWHNVNLEGMIE